MNTFGGAKNNPWMSFCAGAAATECLYQRKTRGKQLKGKIVSACFTLLHTYSYFSEFFRIVPPGHFLRIKGFYYCFSSKRRK